MMTCGTPSEALDDAVRFLPPSLLLVFTVTASLLLRGKYQWSAIKDQNRGIDDEPQRNAEHKHSFPSGKTMQKWETKLGRVDNWVQS